jgi:hypothetical protein
VGVYTYWCGHCYGTCWAIEIMKFLITQFLQPPISSTPSGQNILLSTLFSNTLTLCSLQRFQGIQSHFHPIHRLTPYFTVLVFILSYHPLPNLPLGLSDSIACTSHRTPNPANLSLEFLSQVMLCEAWTLRISTAWHFAKTLCYFLPPRPNGSPQRLYSRDQPSASLPPAVTVSHPHKRREKWLKFKIIFHIVACRPVKRQWSRINRFPRQRINTQQQKNSEFLGFWTLSIVQYFKKHAMFRKVDLFPSSGEKMEECTYLVGPLRKS